MGFPTEGLAKEFESTGHRLGLAIYGTIGFLMSTGLTRTLDLQIYNLAAEDHHIWKPAPPSYPGATKALWLSIPLFLFIFIAPRLTRRMPESIMKNSQSYALLLILSYFLIASISLISFRLNAALAVEFIGYAFIIGSTEYLKGFEFDFSFAHKKSILREARMEKIKFWHKKWFSAISALVTVAIAICVTAAVRLSEIGNEKLGDRAGELLTGMIGSAVIYAGIGLTLGPFAEMFKILARIEDQMDHIEAPENPTLSGVRSKKVNVSE